MSAADPTPAGTGPGEPSAAIAASIRTAFAAASKRDRDHLRARQSAVSYRDGFTLQLEQIVEAWDRAEAVALGALRAAPVAADARDTPTNCQQEPGYPGMRTVMCSLRYPNLVAHRPTEACGIQEPHPWDDCGEVQGKPADARPEAGEPGGRTERQRILDIVWNRWSTSDAESFRSWLHAALSCGGFADEVFGRAATPPGAASGTREHAATVPLGPAVLAEIDRLTQDAQTETPRNFRRSLVALYRVGIMEGIEIQSAAVPPPSGKTGEGEER